MPFREAGGLAHEVSRLAREAGRPVRENLSDGTLHLMGGSGHF